MLIFLSKWLLITVKEARDGEFSFILPLHHCSADYIFSQEGKCLYLRTLTHHVLHSRLRCRVDEWLHHEKHFILPAVLFRRELQHLSPRAVILCIVRLFRHLVWCASLLTGRGVNEPNEWKTIQQWPCKVCGLIELNIEELWKRMWKWWRKENPVIFKVSLIIEYLVI